MKFFKANTADELWLSILKHFNQRSPEYITNSRFGLNEEVLHACLSIEDPLQRYIYSRFPVINLAFAFAEVVWIIKGRKDSKFLKYWNSQLSKYAGFEEDFHGAYGNRLRNNFNIDQIDEAYKALKKNQNSRQIVLQIWDPEKDFPIGGISSNQDVPCNILSLLKIRNNKLEWMQVLRSNDLVLGLPYNIIQFTFLQEIIAGWLELEVGTYNHLSDSLHIYENEVSTKVRIKSKKKIDLLNSDKIRASKKESDEYFNILCDYIDMFVSENFLEKEYFKILNETNLPSAYNNILLILASESARRRGFHFISKELMKNCTNNIFKFIWDNWNYKTKISDNNPPPLLH